MLTGILDKIPGNLLHRLIQRNGLHMQYDLVALRPAEIHQLIDKTQQAVSIVPQNSMQTRVFRRALLIHAVQRS